MAIELYYIPESGPCRAVRLVASVLGVDLNLKFVDMIKGEHLKPEFLKMNVQHQIPVLNDNGFYLTESRAICQYLCDKYGKDDTLYPKDPKKRAIINQRLFFDVETLYGSLVDCYIYPLWKKIPAAPVEKVHNALDVLEKFLEGQNYVAGNNITIADIILQCSVSNLEVFDFDISKYDHKNVQKWFTKVKSEIPKYNEINEDGLKMYRTLVNIGRNM